MVFAFSQKVVRAGLQDRLSWMSFLSPVWRVVAGEPLSLVGFCCSFNWSSSCLIIAQENFKCLPA